MNNTKLESLQKTLLQRFDVDLNNCEVFFNETNANEVAECIDEMIMILMDSEINRDKVSNMVHTTNKLKRFLFWVERRTKEYKDVQQKCLHN
jgi:hypothetical protein